MFLVSDSSADDSGNDYSYSSSSGSGSTSSQSQDSGYNHDYPSTPEHNPDGGTHDDSSGGASGTEEGGAGRTLKFYFKKSKSFSISNTTELIAKSKSCFP